MTGSFFPEEYLPVVILMVIAIGMGFGQLIAGALVRLRRPYKEKLTPYESGNPPTEEPRYQFSVKFYIIAMIFVVFDVEAVFLYPWAITFDKLGLFAFIEMLIFIVILVVGYFYAWEKGAFSWD